MTTCIAGIDIGSTQTKAVVLDLGAKFLASAIIDTGRSMSDAASRVLREAVDSAGYEETAVASVVATGYGRFRVDFGDRQVTEISCHARGAHWLFPSTRTVIDIGGQDTKVIRVTAAGDVDDFTMNDKCAAGTGRFLGACSRVLEVPIDDLGALALTARAPVEITTTCTVFAESEIIGHLAKGRATEDVIFGMHEAVARRTAALTRRVGIEADVTFTGGVSRNPAMASLLQQVLDVPVNVHAMGQLVGALGAALHALDDVTGDPESGQNHGLPDSLTGARSNV